jgi:hypothetical protein
MIFYSQTKGVLTNDGGELIISGCYAGMASGKNNPEMQHVRNAGPLPQGVYTMGVLQYFQHLGPAIPLTPCPTNQMFGRSAFYIHLDNPAHVGFSSDGCIVCQNDPSETGYAKLQQIDGLRKAGNNQLGVTD